ncbi:hypothetical protein MY04_4772 [Flammeovirga sp. MY04]|uniref:hypothetical protein n=1 Tax=Flammeovirga sp. MY04 TaxID=1191459 RepID=UPI000806162B|nr:hypothetical protein [Flammeovirga sp. MY04]ANQ49589.1 hypothetical protein MY04_2215 [Flammeovirga sp. MY04]ANQ52107.1 hypothetical protein MY04_4772 [Flammeovirga sp. MY04]
MSKKINVPTSFVKQVAEELKTSQATVRYAVRYAYNTTLHQKIRSRLKDLLEKEAKAIIIDTGLEERNFA